MDLFAEFVNKLQAKNVDDALVQSLISAKSALLLQLNGLILTLDEESALQFLKISAKAYLNDADYALLEANEDELLNFIKRYYAQQLQQPVLNRAFSMFW